MSPVTDGKNVIAFGRRKGIMFTIKGPLPKNGLLAGDPFVLGVHISPLIRTQAQREHQSLLIAED